MNQSILIPLIEFVFMVGVDILFLAFLILLMMPFGIWRQAAFAVLKRNFVGYFSNPTGYVFLCLFVLLTSFAAFWPHEFFTTNLANFDQLNEFLPYIMLVFIPAITMSLWAEESRQGTDELLLTLPAHDFDIVVGKYFAAVMIFTVSLLFSQLSNYAVLISMTGGDLDSGLLFSTYLGYWFVGIAMLAIGMVASFLTNNLTVGFVFGVAFNAPLAFFSNSDLIVSNGQFVSVLFEWSLLQRFAPFGRGLISLPSMVYFVGLAVLGIYVSMILIGRRHWFAGKDGTALMGHFTLRVFFVLIGIVGLVLVVQHSPLNRWRIDVSREQVSTLSPDTRMLLEKLDQQTDENGDPLPPIWIDAYIGSAIPTDFIKIKYDLVNLLREFDVMGGSRVRVNLHTDVEPFSEDAISAEKRFGIRPVPYVSESRGALRQEQVILGAAFTCGLDRIEVPFFSYGTPVEYELIRSINTVAAENRQVIGIVTSDALVQGAVLRDEDRSVPIPQMGFVYDLQKQYDVENVDLAEPLDVWDDGNADAPRLRLGVLVVVQPSKLAPRELDHLVAAIEAGQPTLIFEDPHPAFSSWTNRRLGGTPEKRVFQRGGTADSGDMAKLWRTLGISVSGRMDANGLMLPDLVWQKINPYPRDRSLDEPETLVISKELDPTQPQMDPVHAATRSLKNYVLFKHAGCFSARPDSKNHIQPIVIAESAGTIGIDVLAKTMRASPEVRDRERGGVIDDRDLILAAHITADENQETPQPGKINCIYVTDADVLADELIQLRSQPTTNGIDYRFENIPFVMNAIDALSTQTEYIDIRGRQVRYVTLRHVEETIKKSTEEIDEELQKLEIQFEQDRAAARIEAENEVKSIQRDVKRMEDDRQKGREIDEAVLVAKKKSLDQEVRSQTTKLRQIDEDLQNDKNKTLRSIRLNAELQIQEIQRGYKLAAVLIPPIPPLLLGLFVFTRRRLREREGIAKVRRLK